MTSRAPQTQWAWSTPTRPSAPWSRLNWPITSCSSQARWTVGTEGPRPPRPLPATLSWRPRRKSARPNNGVTSTGMRVLFSFRYCTIESTVLFSHLAEATVQEASKAVIDFRYICEQIAVRHLALPVDCGRQVLNPEPFGWECNTWTTRVDYPAPHR